MKEIDFSSLQIDGLETWDYPDFSDVFICYGEYTDGSLLEDVDLQALNDDASLIYKLVEKTIY